MAEEDLEMSDNESYDLAEQYVREQIEADVEADDDECTVFHLERCDCIPLTVDAIGKRWRFLKAGRRDEGNIFAHYEAD